MTLVRFSEPLGRAPVELGLLWRSSSVPAVVQCGAEFGVFVVPEIDGLRRGVSAVVLARCRGLGLHVDVQAEVLQPA